MVSLDNGVKIHFSGASGIKPLLVILLAVLSGSAVGQMVPAPPDRIGQPGMTLPSPEQISPVPGFDLPDVDSLTPPAGRLSAGLRIVPRRFEITGSSVFSTPELEKEAEPYLNRPVGSEDLEELRLRLTRRYVAAGYVNSGALIPDQEVRDGVIAIQIMEGRLDEIDVTVSHRFDPDFIRARLMLGAGSPLHVGSLQERMQLLLQNPQIERINAELAPGDRPGAGVLRVAVTEAPRHTIGLAFANHRSPSVGSERLELLGAMRNLTGRGDAWTLRLGRTRGLSDHALQVSIPINAADTVATLRHERNNAAVIEQPFDVLNIDSRSRTTEVGLRHPVYRSLQRSLTLGAALALREAETRLDGEPFSFSPGSRNGRSEVSALRLTAEWLARERDAVFSARAVISRGLDAFGATINRDGTPDSRFTAALFQAQWARRLGEGDAQLILRADAQASNAALLSLEKFAIGGADSVRGFREGRLIRDRGWVASMEWRLPVARLPLPGLTAQPEGGQLSLAMFTDAGQVWDKGGAREGLWGAGPGVRWDINPDSYAQLYWAGLRHRAMQAGDDAQDRGVHFRLVLQKHF